MKKIKILVLATGDIAVPLLRALADDKRFSVAAVVTGVDRPAGRKMEVKASPGAAAARDLGIPVEQPEKIGDPDVAAKLCTLQPDLIILMAYGQILSAKVLAIPRVACVNVHVSLLPKHRGASPVPSAILAGNTETGISIMQMAEKMDAGPVYERFAIPIADDDNALTVSDKLAQLAAQKAPDVLVQIAEGKISPQPQDESRATLCQKISKADGQIDWNEPAETIARLVRAYAGWPGTWTTWNGKGLKIIEANLVDHDGEPGIVIQKEGTITVGAKKGSLGLITVQLEGKKAMPIWEFIKGYPDLIHSSLRPQKKV